MATTTKRTNAVLNVAGLADWSEPTGPAFIQGNTEVPYPTGGLTPVYCVMDEVGSAVYWDGLAATFPNAGIQQGSTITGIKFVLYANRKNTNGTVSELGDGSVISDRSVINAGNIGVIFGNQSAQLSSCVASPRAHVDQIPVRDARSVPSSDALTLGDDNTMWGFSSAQLLSYVNNGQVAYFADYGTFGSIPGNLTNEYRLAALEMVVNYTPPPSSPMDRPKAMKLIRRLQLVEEIEHIEQPQEEDLTAATVPAPQVPIQNV